MAPTGNAVAAFVEAHYYSGGLRHHYASLEGARPAWAPPHEDVGFRDEFPLSSGDVVIEFQHRKFKENLLTWVAMYGPSVDEKLGDRANHSGVGVWLCGLSLTNTGSVVHGLQQLMSVVASGVFNEKIFENNAAKFLAEWLPRYVHDIVPFQIGFSGVRFAESALTNTSIYEIETGEKASPYELAAQKLTMLSFLEIEGHPSRALMFIPGDPNKRLAPGKAELIKADTNYLSEFISRMPNILQGSSITLASLRECVASAESHLQKLSNENASLTNKLLEADRERAEALQRLSVLERETSKGGSAADIRDVKYKLDDLLRGQIRLEKLATKSIVGPDGRPDFVSRDANMPLKDGGARKARGAVGFVLFYGLWAAVFLAVFALAFFGGRAAIHLISN